MKRIFGSRTILIGIATGAFACAAPEAEKPAETAPASAQTPTAGDPVQVDAAHYRAEFENERVRILRITYGPGESSEMHRHPDAVAVFLTPHHVEFRAPDGTSTEVHGEAHTHRFTPAASHLPKNIGTEPLEVVLVELKDAPSPAPAEKGADPTSVDAAHYKAEFENDRVRVLRIAYGAGEESVMHHHPDSVAVFLTPHHVRFTMPDGSTAEVQAQAGEHRFVAGGMHLPKNIGSKPWELVLVELK